MNRIEDILEEEGCIKTGHFLLKSGKHSGTYCDLKSLSHNPKAMKKICKILSVKIQREIQSKYLKSIDVVVGPAIGGIVPAYQIASKLKVQFNFTEKVDNKDKTTLDMDFRDASNIAGKNILVVEDVTTTGGTINQTIDAINAYGGNLVAVAVLVDRSNNIDFGVPLFYGTKLEIPVYESNDCKICKEGKIDLYKPGSKN